MPDPAKILLEVDGEPHPATRCRWIEISPCGCISGLTRAYVAGELHRTGEDAFLRDRPKVVRDYEMTLGSRYKLITAEQYHDTYAAQMGVHCPHTPQWGMPVIPVPDGWVWMTTDGVGRSSYRKHIVPDDIEKDPDPQIRVRGSGTALCGKDSSYWFSHQMRLVDTIPCKKCVTRANETSPAPETPDGALL
jgi:hypothetical protein